VNVQVYTKPGCVQCEYTEKKLDELHIPHDSIDVTQDPAALQRVMDTGRLQMPMVVAGEQKWHGFHYDKLRGLDPRDYT
jgi:glutaredoxin-like protein NrdH